MPQTLTEIRAMLASAGLSPQRMFGQNFMVDHNLLGRLVALAEPGPLQRVLEVGPGTGTLTEELLATGAEVLSVEIDRGLAGLLRDRLGNHERFHLLHTDALAGKHRIAPAVLETLAGLGDGPAKLVSNLPYNIATSLIVECLLLGRPGHEDAPVRFESLTFTVQREVTERLVAGPGSGAYGPVSVMVALYGQATLGPLLPPEAFWPRPTVTSRMMRIDVRLADAGPDPRALSAVLTACFGQRRKRIGSVGRRRGSPWDDATFSAALASVGIDGDQRPEQVAPAQFAALSQTLAP